jgi:hypothetical protein
LFHGFEAPGLHLFENGDFIIMLAWTARSESKNERKADRRNSEEPRKRGHSGDMERSETERLLRAKETLGEE